MSRTRCDCCGKFKKESDCVAQEHSGFDGLVREEWVECRDCMSEADEKRYFNQETKEAEKIKQGEK